MLRAGSSLREVGQVLRHRGSEVTSIYAKVDRRALAALVQPWPGGSGMSALERHLDEYLTIRRGLGFKLTSEQRMLNGFVAFMLVGVEGLLLQRAVQRRLRGEAARDLDAHVDSPVVGVGLVHDAPFQGGLGVDAPASPEQPLDACRSATSSRTTCTPSPPVMPNAGWG
jgi:hypothetical protein